MTCDVYHTETQRKPVRTASGTFGVQSFSTDSSLSPSGSHVLIPKYDDEDVEEPGEQATLDRENSFEDLEQFLTQVDWVPPHSTDEPGSDADSACSSSVEPEQDESHVQELEKRALKDHLKAIIKDIHIAIGEP